MHTGGRASVEAEAEAAEAAEALGVPRAEGDSGASAALPPLDLKRSMTPV
jgi:hypothetical protein